MHLCVCIRIMHACMTNTDDACITNTLQEHESCMPHTQDNAHSSRLRKKGSPLPQPLQPLSCYPAKPGSDATGQGLTMHIQHHNNPQHSSLDPHTSLPPLYPLSPSPHTSLPSHFPPLTLPSRLSIPSPSPRLIPSLPPLSPSALYIMEPASA